MQELVSVEKKSGGTSNVVIPFRYPGGKYYALPYLSKFYLSVPHDEYREPFAGGASVFFAKPLAKLNWLNDLDPELMNCYRIMANTKKRAVLIELLSKEVATKERWREVREFQPHNIIERAFKYYYLNRTSFSGKMISPAWGYRPKRSIPPQRWCEKIGPCGQKLNDVKLSCSDFSEVIEAPAKGKQVLLFVDPPYFVPPKRKHYVNGFIKQDHLRLAGLLHNTNHKFILTYEDVKEIRELYNWANIYSTKFFYRVDNSQTQKGKRRIGHELVITNFKLPEEKRVHELS